MKTKRLGIVVLLTGLYVAAGLFTACGGDDDGGGNGDLSREGEYDLTWLSIPGGSFEMGCSPNDDDCYSDEEPRHSVNVPGFKMTKFEVTNAQYAAFLNDRGNNNCADYPCVDAEDDDLRLSESGGVWSADGGYENHPLVEVTWYGAKAFCEAAGGRLPSEAEWEYAARAGTTTKYYCGDDYNCLDDIACWKKSDTCPVGQYAPNDFGLYDMLGGVWEWVEDCYHDDYTGAPTDGSVWDDEQCSSLRVLRGGSWGHNTDRYLRASGRLTGDPDFWDDFPGFRCARDGESDECPSGRPESGEAFSPERARRRPGPSPGPVKAPGRISPAPAAASRR